MANRELENFNDDQVYLRHSAKYKKLIRDIRYHRIVHATGHCFTIKGYVRDGIKLNEKKCHIVFRRKYENEPHGILFSDDRTKVEIIHDFNDWDFIFNDHRINSDGSGNVIAREYISDRNVVNDDDDDDEDVDLDDDDDDDEDVDLDEDVDNSNNSRALECRKPVFVSFWSVFEQYVTYGEGVIVDKWFTGTN